MCLKLYRKQYVKVGKSRFSIALTLIPTNKCLLLYANALSNREKT